MCEVTFKCDVIYERSLCTCVHKQNKEEKLLLGMDSLQN